MTKLAVTGANARFDGYTAENQELVRSFDPDAEPVSDTYARFLLTAQTTGPSFSAV